MSAQGFRDWIRVMAEKRGPIVLALDYNIEDSDKLLQRSAETVKEVAPYICAVKVNHQLLLPLGLYAGVKKIIDLSHELELPIIMDGKINDVGSTNQAIASHYFGAGFDAVIANPFIGWDEGAEPIFAAARGGRGVILLVYMSHKGAAEGYGQKVIDPKTGKERSQYMVFAEKAAAWNADGMVIGATHPEKIAEVNRALKGKVPIYAPGVGTQGGDAQAALSAGASYLIVGRSIIGADSPAKAARELWEAVGKHS